MPGTGSVRLVDDDVDFAFAAYRRDGAWHLDDLAETALESVERLAAAVGRFDSGEGALGLVGVDEDFFVLVRVEGTTTRVLLSDVTAADEWELAESAVDHLGLPDPLDGDDVGPAGDLAIVADLGMHAVDMGVLIDDVELYPDEMISDIARRLGFGADFDEAVGLDNP